MSEEYSSFLIGALTGLVAGLSALVAYYATNRQNLLSATGVAGDWLRDLRAWASEAVDVLSEAIYSCPLSLSAMSEVDQAAVARHRHRLSALIDRGRFLLPNERDNEYGHGKASAYRGFRPPALDALVAAERILGQDIDLCSFPDEKAALIYVKREFVSITQGILDPRSMNKSVAAVLRHAQDDRKRDATLGGLLPDPTRVPQGDENLLYEASRRYQDIKSR